MQWNQPNQPNPNPAPAQTTAVPAANPWGPSVTAPTQPFYPQANPVPQSPLTTAQSLSGMGDLKIRLDYPQPPPDAQFTFELVAARGVRSENKQSGAKYLSYIFEVSVLTCATHPALVGQIVTLKVNGFENPKREKNAKLDLMSLLVVLKSDMGLTPETRMTTEQWAQVAESVAPDRDSGRASDCVGKRGGCATRMWVRPGTENLAPTKENRKVLFRVEKAA